MSNARLIAAATNLADVIDGIDGGVWGGLTCPEIDAFADLLLAVGREDAAATLIVRHSYADTEDNEDTHAEIGEAARAQDGSGIEWADRQAYRLAVVHLIELEL